MERFDVRLSLTVGFLTSTHATITASVNQGTSSNAILSHLKNNFAKIKQENILKNRNDKPIFK
jgi:hypothetical protein